MKTPIKLFLCLLVIAAFSFTTPTTTSKKETVVVIDLSHGGDDFGVQVDGISEKDVVQQIGYKIAEANSDKGIKIHFTRTHDTEMSLSERVNFINSLKPDVVLSLHINSSENPEHSGVEIYVAETSQKSKELADKLSLKFIATDNFNEAKVKKANFYLLKNTKVPAMTVELGFLSNERNRNDLVNTEQQTEIAKTILEFVSDL
ncbi:N-acetylmuramoyl-L-alanine amidase [Ulvibacter sp. MAR_2010_11]|uniref:N-acetylmuramoyl-L-alanine amidase n=1 Tax=Ulvibacter sp. MAR_2010_11 TaxID=1250229 RepID=UPI000C2BFF68|nr:N-acetylmuramoyl-L-alanine amidase [Ulvibacter sp. MAR_2010_11]PKA84035.1 N-acetylmuramoyl-L-alanine amidase [Ulvibacter sp. MAR_2010_11]